MTRPTFAVTVTATYHSSDTRPGTDPYQAWKKATGRLMFARVNDCPASELHLQVAYRVSCMNAQNAIHFALALLEKDMGKAGLVSPHARPVGLKAEAELALVALPDEQVAA